MKKLLIGAGVIATISQNVMAAEGQFPVLKTEKSCQLVVPEGLSSAQVYFSKDCSTAYVLPPKRMKMVVSKPVLLPGADDKFCVAMDKKLASIGAIREKIDSLNNAIFQILMSSESVHAANENKIKDLRRQIRQQQLEIKNIAKPYDSMPAMRAKISLANEVMESIRAFQEANRSAVSEGDSIYPVRFMPAHITDSVAAISNADPEAYAIRSVVKVDFPAESVAAPEGVTRDENTTYVAMNGGLSGVVDVSTAAYCSNKDSRASMEDVFANVIAVNLSYKVRVQVGVKVVATARIQTKDFLRNLENVIQKGKFTRGEFINDVIMGGLENSLHIMIDDKGEKYALSDLLNNDETNSTKSLLAPLLSKFMTSYVQRAEDKLEQLGVFTKADPMRATEVPNGSEQVQTGTVRSCRSSSSWGGLFSSSSCSTAPIYVQVDHDGISRLAQDQRDDSYIQETISYETNETTTIQHTSEFARIQ